MFWIPLVVLAAFGENPECPLSGVWEVDIPQTKKVWLNSSDPGPSEHFPGFEDTEPLATSILFDTFKNARWELDCNFLSFKETRDDGTAPETIHESRYHWTRSSDDGLDVTLTDARGEEMRLRVEAAQGGCISISNPERGLPLIWCPAE